MARVPSLAEEIPWVAAGGKVCPGKGHPVGVWLLCFRHEFIPARLHVALLGAAPREGEVLLLQPAPLPAPDRSHRHTQMPAQGEGGVASLSDSINLQDTIVQFSSSV